MCTHTHACYRVHAASACACIAGKSYNTLILVFTSLPACPPARLPACPHAYMHTCIHAYAHTRIHAYTCLWLCCCPLLTSIIRQFPTLGSRIVGFGLKAGVSLLGRGGRILQNKGCFLCRLSVRGPSSRVRARTSSRPHGHASRHRPMPVRDTITITMIYYTIIELTLR